MTMFEQAQRITIQREVAVGSTTAAATSAITVTAETSGSVTGYASTHGSVSPGATFTLNTYTYTIEELLSQNNELELRLDRALPFGAQVSLTISSTVHLFDVEDATIDLVSGEYLYTWALANQSAGTWTLVINQTAGAELAIPIADITPDIQSAHDERNDYTGTGLQPLGGETQRLSTIGFSTVLAWEGTEYHGLRTAITDMLNASGFYGTPVDTTEAWEYHQTLPDLAIYSQTLGTSVRIRYDDGRYISTMTGCRGEVSFSFATGSSVRLNFQFTGHLPDTPAESATRLPAPTFTVARGSQNATISLQATGRDPLAVTVASVNSYEFTMGNSVGAPPSISGDGYGDVQINGRAPMVTLNVLQSATSEPHPPGYEGLLEGQEYSATASIDNGGGNTALSLTIATEPLETTGVSAANDQSLLGKALSLAVRDGTSPVELRWEAARGA